MAPTGTPVNLNCPWLSVCVIRVVPWMEMVAPGTGRFVFVRAMPEKEVFAGSEGIMPDAVKVTGRPVFPRNVASTLLFEIPSSGPKIQVACALPSELDSIVAVVALSTLPPPDVTVNVTGMPETGFPELSDAIICKGEGRALLTSPLNTDSPT